MSQELIAFIVVGSFFSLYLIIRHFVRVTKEVDDFFSRFEDQQKCIVCFNTACSCEPGKRW